MSPPEDDGDGTAGTAAGPDPGALVGRLLGWFDGRERDVPWRDEDDPYRIWVAEVMAQQTRLQTVREYYGPFFRRFPDVEALARAELDEVLKAWEGLGYYARARHLHRAARRIARDRDGRLPRQPSELQELPGVGPYTAGAVASIAFGRREPAVDGNARRVLARLFDMERPTPARLESRARELLDAVPERPAALNQALMDLGGEVCTPSSPDCPSCPVSEGCLARQRGTESLRPPARERGPVPHHDVGVGVVWRDERMLVARRPEDAMLGGLWEFPGGKLEEGESPPEAIRRELREEMSIEVRVGPLVERVDHAYSHLRVTLHSHHARLVSGTPRAVEATECRWCRLEELDELAFPVANQRILERLRDQEGAPAF